MGVKTASALDPNCMAGRGISQPLWVLSNFGARAKKSAGDVRGDNLAVSIRDEGDWVSRLGSGTAQLRASTFSLGSGRCECGIDRGSVIRRKKVRCEDRMERCDGSDYHDHRRCISKREEGLRSTDGRPRSRIPLLVRTR